MDKILIISKIIYVFVTGIILTSCSVLAPVKQEHVATYALDASIVATATGKGERILQVSAPVARPGYESARMVYIQKPHALEYFAHNQWVDAPARMMAPLIMQALENSGHFKAVVSSRSGIQADLRLDIELVRLQQEFTEKPSQVRLTLRVQLIDLNKKAILAQREFDVLEPCASDEPYAGVVSANTALQKILQQMAEFSGKAGG